MHTHLIALGILLHAYLCLLANDFLFSLFKGRFNENNCHEKVMQTIVIHCYKLKKNTDEEDYMRYALENFNEIVRY